MLTWKELWTYARILLRWWPILALATVLSAGTAWFLSRGQPDFYHSRASLSVGNNFAVSSPERFAVEVSNSLARYYDVLAHREVILQPVVERLGLQLPWQLISDNMLAIEINPQANLLEIGVTDTDPQRAAAIANAIGEELIAFSPNSSEKAAAQQAEVERQINETKASLDDTDRRLAELRARQQQLNAAVDLRENQDQIAELEKARESYQTTYNSLLALHDNSSVNTLGFFERAAPALAPLPQKTTLVIGGAGLGGLLVAAVAVLLLDMLDERWKPGSDLRRRTGLVHLGNVRYGPRGAIISGEQRAVRETHTQLVLAANERPPRSLLISSPEPSEERSAFAIDLASVYGQAGHRVLLVDAELARSHMTRILAEREGGADYAPSSGAIERWSQSGGQGLNTPAELWMRLRPTSMANVALLPGRAAGGDYPILVPLLHWPELVASLHDVADVLIFDGPSALTGADAALLAPLVDGVVLALSPDEHSRAQIAETQSRLLRPGARILGAVTVSSDRRQRVAKSARLPFSVAVDRGGLTITLPSRDTPTSEQPLLEEGPARHNQQSAAGSAQTDGWGDLRPAELHERAVGEPAAIVTPPAPDWLASADQAIITPPPQAGASLITPPPAQIAPSASDPVARRGEVRRRVARSTRAAIGGRGLGRASRVLEGGDDA
ncbi:MAG: lipopolysaccharide biosynthesis protein [Chloroflexales bacterium]|nr:lipopolysaccharide biosynthesis protein [Chloroflexales bacterium]